MRHSAEVVIVGAGITGTSTAFHLAKMGMKDVVVVEQSHLAAGATGKSGALVRMHYTNEHETQLAVESLRYFQNWGDMVGGDCGFNPVGLLVFTPQEYREHLEANVAMQRRLGATAQVITAQEALDLDPSVSVHDVTHLAYEPDAGYADSNATTFSLAQAAKDRGVEFLLDTRVNGVRTEDGKVVGVDTTAGSIDAPVVLVAAGAWANQLFAPLGIELELMPSLARVTVFRWPPERSSQHMTYIDHINHTWVRPIDGNSTLIGAEFGVRHGADPHDFSEAVSQDYIDLCRQQVMNRFPVMRHSTMRGNWAGILMRSPDSRPVLDQLPQYEGLFCITGDSGTSFKTAPAIGKCMAEWIAEGTPRTIDLSPFRASRFEGGGLWQDEFDYGLQRATISR